MAPAGDHARRNDRGGIEVTPSERHLRKLLQSPALPGKRRRRLYSKLRKLQERGAE